MAGAAVAPPLGSERRRRRGWTAERGALGGLLLSLPLLCLVAVFLVYPLVKLATTALGAPHHLGNVADFFDSSANTRVMRITFVDAAIVTALCVLLGSVVSWSLRTSRRPAVRVVLWSAVFVPVLMGSVIKLYAFTVLLGTHGVVNRALQGIGLVDHPVHLLYTQFAVVVGMVYQMLPFAVLPLYAGFRTIDLDLVTAAESLGAGRLRALVSIVGPLAIPNLLAAGTLVYVISIGFFLTPVLLGGATAPFTASFIAQDVFQFFDVTSAAVSALMLLAGGLAILGVVYLLVGRERMARAVAP